MADTPKSLNPAYAARQRLHEGLTLEQARELSTKDLELARAQFKAITDAESDLRKRLLSDHTYIDGVTLDENGDPVGRMWTDKERSDRKGRPTIEADALSGPIAQVSNALAESRPAARMDPIGGGADPEKAEVWQGLLRRIQTAPEAEFAGAYAADHLAKIGRGSWLLRHKFPEYNGDPNDPANWEMELVRSWIDNQHQVFLGAASEPDGTDRLSGFILQPFTKEQFDARFGEGEFEKNKAAFKDLDAGHMSAWLTGETIIVASWYRIKLTDVTLTATDGMGRPRTRVVKERRCCHSIITATTEYEYEELPIPYVPIIQGEARRSNVNGQKDCKGIVRRGRQPQDMVNVWTSYIAETIGRAARQEVVMAAGQEKGLEQFWDMSQRLPYRLYNPIDVNGKLAQMPNIVSLEPPIQAMSLALQQAEAQTRKATLFFDADTDETGAERSKLSGVAFKERRRSGELGNSDFMRAYKFMIQAETKILMAWIPKVYEAARVLRITGRDDKEMTVVTHFGQQFAGEAERLKGELQQARPNDEAVKGVYDLSTGRYDIKADVEPNPLTQRQETREILGQVIPALPPEMQMKSFPVLLKSIDGPAGRELAQVFDPKQQQQGPTVEEAMKAQQMMDVLSKRVSELEAELASKEKELAVKVEIADRQNAAEIEKERIKQQGETERATIQAKATIFSTALEPQQPPASPEFAS